MSTGGGPKIIKDNLIVSLDFGNEKSFPKTGTAAFNLKRNGYDSTLRNGATYDTETGGNITFDGTNDEILIPSVDMRDDYTLEIVVKATGNSLAGAKGYNTLFGASSTFRFLYHLNGFLLAQIQGTNHLSTTGIAPRNQWNVIHYTFNNLTNQRQWFVNGIGDTILTSASNGFNGNMYIGSHNTINYRMNGKIAITRIYNKVLSTGEIAQNYNAFRGRFGL